MRKADLQQQAVELIKQLSTEKLKAGIDYLTYLQDKKGWEATHELPSAPETAESLGAKPRAKIRLHNVSLKLSRNRTM